MKRPTQAQAHELADILRQQVPAVADGAGSTGAKYFRLVELADKANAIVAPTTPCKRGCSACCHIAVAITQTEATVIAAATGRAYVEQTDLGLREKFDRITGNVKLYSGVPCTFLGKEGECTIYKARPVACRTHHTIAPDASNCEVTQGLRPVPQVDLRPIDYAVAWLLQDEPFADIRQFFPPLDGNPATTGEKHE